MKLRKISSLLLLFTLVLQPAFAQVPAPTPNPVPGLNRVIWLWLENTSYDLLYNLRYTKSLWRNYPSVRFNSFLPLTNVTQSNVVSMISGTDGGVKDNNLTRIFNPTILDLLESKNIPWKVYAEDFPGSCYLGGGIGNYRRYRVPFLSIAQVQADRYQCMKIVNFSVLAEDIRNGSLPRFSFVIPNLLSSGGVGSELDADNTLKAILDPIVKNQDIMAETTIIISTTNLTNAAHPSAFQMILGKGVSDYGLLNSNSYSHYHLLRTLEEGLGLGNLNQNDTKVDPMVGFWK